MGFRRGLGFRTDHGHFWEAYGDSLRIYGNRICCVIPGTARNYPPRLATCMATTSSCWDFSKGVATSLPRAICYLTRQLWVQGFTDSVGVIAGCGLGFGDFIRLIENDGKERETTI